MVIGCGKIGSQFSQGAKVAGVHSHAQAYHENGKTILAGLVDCDEVTVSAASQFWGVEGSPEYQSLYHRIQPDIVSICTPDETHYEVIMKLLNEQDLPRVIFTEKPMVSSSVEAQEVVTLASEKGVRLCVNYSRRFSGGFRSVAKRIQQKGTGVLLSGVVYYGKGLLHNGSHAIDLLNFWFGELEVLSVRKRDFAFLEDECFDVDFVTKEGAVIHLKAVDHSMVTIFEGDFLFSRERIQFKDGGSSWELSQLGESATYPGYQNYLAVESDKQVTEMPALEQAVREIVNCIEDGSPISCSGDDGARVVSQVEKIRSFA
ncbi:MAG: Gfo/Idh/MocA family oxidoreductase [Verrucomicrobiota bacterium]